MASTLRFGSYTQKDLECVERYYVTWFELINRVHYNRLSGEQQRAYEERLRKQVRRPRYRAFIKNDMPLSTFIPITQQEYEDAMACGVPVRTKEST